MSDRQILENAMDRNRGSSDMGSAMRWEMGIQKYLVLHFCSHPQDRLKYLSSGISVQSPNTCSNSDSLSRNSEMTLSESVILVVVVICLMMMMMICDDDNDIQ